MHGKNGSASNARHDALFNPVFTADEIRRLISEDRVVPEGNSEDFLFERWTTNSGKNTHNTNSNLILFMPVRSRRRENLPQHFSIVVSNSDSVEIKLSDSGENLLAIPFSDFSKTVPESLGHPTALGLSVKDLSFFVQFSDRILVFNLSIHNTESKKAKALSAANNSPNLQNQVGHQIRVEVLSSVEIPIPRSLSMSTKAPLKNNRRVNVFASNPRSNSFLFVEEKTGSYASADANTGSEIQGKKKLCENGPLLAPKNSNAMADGLGSKMDKVLLSCPSDGKMFFFYFQRNSEAANNSNGSSGKSIFRQPQEVPLKLSKPMEKESSGAIFHEETKHGSLQTFWSPGQHEKKINFFGQKIEKMSKNSDFGPKKRPKMTFPTWRPESLKSRRPMVIVPHNDEISAWALSNFLVARSESSFLVRFWYKNRCFLTFFHFLDQKNRFFFRSYLATRKFEAIGPGAAATGLWTITLRQLAGNHEITRLFYNPTQK